jgi:predicted SAM-dependent methyltransferase
VRKILTTIKKNEIRSNNIKKNIKKIIPYYWLDLIKSLFNELSNELTYHTGSYYLKKLRGKKNLRINLGCGNDIKMGWVNIDLSTNVISDSGLNVNEETFTINYDLRRGLDLDEDSCCYIYSSHFFEHLDYRAAIKLMQDCFSALRPGGIFRIVLPNQREIFSAYISGNHGYFYELKEELGLSYQSLIDYVNFEVYQCTHKCLYDEEKLSNIFISGYRPHNYTIFKVNVMTFSARHFMRVVFFYYQSYGSCTI